MATCGSPARSFSASRPATNCGGTAAVPDAGAPGECRLQGSLRRHQRCRSSDLRLPPGSNALRFQFAALAYGNPAETEYQYLLEGADKDWSAWGKQKEANYSGLGPGNYRFRVRSRTDDGRTGEEGVYSFTILPPWYRTTLA